MGANGSRDANGASSDPTVKTLVVAGKNLNSDDYKALTDSLKYNKSIGRVDLAALRIGPARLRELAKSLHENPTLTAVSLKDNVVCADNGKALSEVLSANKTLLTLMLEGNDIGSKGCKELAQALTVNLTLTELDLTRNMIGPDGMKYLAEVFRSNATLRILRLEQNWAGVDGCQAIADALKNFAKLTHLNLARNEIGDDGARMLANAIKHNRSLVKLELQENGITADGCDDLADAVEFGNLIIESIMFGSKEEKLKKSDANKRLQQLLERNRLRAATAGQRPAPPPAIEPDTYPSISRQDGSTMSDDRADGLSMRSVPGSTFTNGLDERQQLTLTYNGESRSMAVSSRSDTAAIEKAICLMFNMPVGTPVMLMDTSSCVIPIDNTLKTGIYTAVFSQPILTNTN